MEPQTLLDVSGAVPPGVTQELVSACHSGAFARIQSAVLDSIAEGWPVRPASLSHGPPGLCMGQLGITLLRPEVMPESVGVRDMATCLTDNLGSLAAMHGSAHGCVRLAQRHRHTIVACAACLLLAQPRQKPGCASQHHFSCFEHLIPFSPLSTSLFTVCLHGRLKACCWSFKRPRWPQTT